MIKLEKKKKNIVKKNDDEYEKIYLVHHMHHLKMANKGVGHALHHCFLFSKKNMQGKRYSIIHKVYKDNVCHCIAEKFTGKLYDHANNVFNIVCKKINGKKIYEIKI